MRIVQVGGFVLALLILGGVDASVHAQKAAQAPPTGAWSGKLPDERTFLLIVSGPSATIEVRAKGAAGTTVTGPWNWTPNATGGVLTIVYRNTNGQNRLSCTVTYVDAQTLTVEFSHTRVTLTRL